MLLPYMRVCFECCFAEEGGAGESAQEFENRLFRNQQGQDDTPFFRNLDRAGNSFERQGMGSGMGAFGRRGGSGNSGSGDMGNFGFGESMDGFDSLNDGMNEKLDDAARTFHMTDEVDDDDYDYRPDVNYRRGSTYSVKVRGISVHYFNGSSIATTLYSQK